jgi:predicted RNA-binding protein with PIN domain
MTISIETIQPLNIFFKSQETTAQTRFEKSFENWRKLGDVIAEVIAITGGKNWSDKAVQKSVDEGKLDNSALTLLANLTDIQARNILRADCVWLAENIKDAEFVIAQRKDKNKKNTSLASLKKQVREWRKECDRAERIKNPAYRAMAKRKTRPWNK